MKVGLKKVIETQKAMGWDKVAIPQVPSTLLGSYSISPYDVTKLYQTIANQGSKIPLSTIDSITDQKGNLLYQREYQAEQVVPAEAAYQTIYAMQQVVERGTGRSLQSHFADLHLAGKTGTTNDARDTWFVGIDGDNVTTVWLGRADNGDTKLTGATGALQIYQDYLQRANPVPLKPTKPEQIKWVGINSYGGWDCSNWRTIPVWADKNQSFCQAAPAPVASAQPATNSVNSTNKAAESVWDVLNEKSNAPIEEAKPTR